MKIENFKKAAPFRMFFPILLVSSIVCFLFYFLESAKYNYILLIIGGILMILYVFFLLKKPHYFSLEIKFKSLLINYFNPHPFFTKYKAVEILFEDFEKYQITESLGGIVKYLTIWIKKGKKAGSYPPISISLLNENQIKILKTELDRILKIKSLK